MAKYRYGQYVYGPDPLALPYDVRGAVDEMSEDILAGADPQDALRDLPPFQTVEVDGDGVVEVSRPAAQRDVESLTQERPHGVTQEPLELIEPDGARAGRVERATQERGNVVARAQGGPGAGQMEGVEAPRSARQEDIAFEVPRIEGLQG